MLTAVDVSEVGIKNRKSPSNKAGGVCIVAFDRFGMQNRKTNQCPAVIALLVMSLCLCIALACRSWSRASLVQKQSGKSSLVAQTPPLGWRSWNYFKLEIDQHAIQAQINALTMPGPHGNTLADLGFVSVGVDDGWQSCNDGVFHDGVFHGVFHDAAGIPQLNRTRFPNLHALSHYAHSRGIKLGWYFNNCWCNELGKVSWGGHPDHDVAFLAEYELDEVKVDGCGPAHDIARWKALIANTGRPILLENCGNNPEHPAPSKPPWPWSPAIPEDLQQGCPFHMYRVSDDIAPHFLSTMWNLQQMLPFLDRDKPLSRPGCWAYPDMLQVMNGLSVVESRSHFGAWVITSSPLILGFDLRDHMLVDSVWPIIGNEAAIAVNQNWVGHPGFLVWSSEETFNVLVTHGAEDERGPTSWQAPVAQIWAKPQPDKAVAVLLLNLSSEKRTVTFQFKDVDISAGAKVTDIWTGSQRGHFQGEFTALLAPHDSAFLFLTPLDTNHA